jgi:hypothetical protein
VRAIARRRSALDGGPPARAKPRVGEEPRGRFGNAAGGPPSGGVRARRRDAAEIHQKGPSVQCRIKAFVRHALGPPTDGRPGRGLQGRLPARPGDAADRRPLPRRGEDRRPRRGGDRGRGPHHAAHPALAGTDRRDHRRTHRPRRLRPGPGGRGHPHLQPDPRPAHPVPPIPGARPGAPGSTTRP